MQITINGADHILDEGTSIANMLKELNLDPRKFAVEQNLAIVTFEEYESTYIEDGDIIEIVQFIGGG
jgi:thiamine biosynthesis protein ThiS